MKGETMLVLTENGEGEWEIYDDTYDITIHCQSKEENERVMKIINAAAKGNGWIGVEESMPENANHPGETCPRLLILSKTFGPTEGWYNPDHHCWYGLIWRMTGEGSIEHDIDMVRGDIPCVVKNLDVIAWKPYPEGKETE